MTIHFRTWTGALGLLASALGLISACGSDDEGPKDGAVGAACDPAESGSCEMGLDCTARGEGNVCTFPAGAVCQPGNGELQNGGCADTAVCEGQGDGGTGQPLCLLLEGGECDPRDQFCADGLTCAELASGGYRCFGKVVLRGQVTDSSTADGIEGAQVIASNDEGVAVSDVAETDAEGDYSLPIPAPRNDDGSPANANFTLRAAAQDYQPFPQGIRVALPINAATAVRDGKGYVIENALTDIALIPLPAAERQSISGKLLEAPLLADGGTRAEVGGVLVVATGPGGSFTGVTDKSGNYTIFNVPDGDYTVRAYAAGVQVQEEQVSVSGQLLQGLELTQLSDSTTLVSGNIQLVNAPGNAATSVILVVEDTFDADAARGEVPRGLRAPRTGEPSVTGDFEIANVPAGRYVVLAAYENDDLVRDPDTNIAGTDFVHITVDLAADAVTLPESFKVTEALAVEGPGAEQPEAVSEKPTLVWADDSSEDWYELRVFDAFGNEVWADENVPSVSGSTTASRQYEGPLDVGMYYQFRVTSWRQPGNGAAAPISATEDLRGVFFLPAN